MAFKYQALNESHSSLNSLSSLGSSRSIDSPGAGGGGRQRPRLEFSAAGTCGVKRRNSLVAMTEAADQSSFPVPSPSLRQRGGDPEGVSARSGSKWRQSVVECEKTMTEERSTAANAGGDLASNTASRTALVQKNWDSTDSSKEPNFSAESVASETGLYIHSSVRSGGSGLRFSRQVGDGRTRSPLHQHNHNQRSEHGKLFRALQKFSNKRAQQRVEMESEKRAKKSPPHRRDGCTRTGSERGREKENVTYQKRSAHQKNKQGKKWRLPVSKSSDRLSTTFSDVVFRDHSNGGEFDSLDHALETDTLIYANTTNERLLCSGESQGLPLSHVHHNSSRGHKYRSSMPPFHEVQDDDGASRCTSASVRRAHSLNEGVHHGCASAMDTGVLPATGVSRNGSAKKKLRYLQ